MNRQNMTGNVPLGDPKYVFRPIPAPHTHRAPGVPEQYTGGDFGYSTTLNPITPVNSDGREIPFARDFTFKAPLYVHVDSENRDQSIYPNPATFRMKFHAGLRGVYSIEVLEVIYPNPQTAPPGNYVLLLSGLHNGLSFQRQKTANAGIFQSMLSDNVDPGQAHNSIVHSAMAKMKFDVTLPDQYWRRTEVRQIKYYSPEEEKVGTMEFTLAFADGTPLDLDPDARWSAILEVVCKSS